VLSEVEIRHGGEVLVQMVRWVLLKVRSTSWWSTKKESLAGLSLYSKISALAMTRGEGV
jgi:hypothetical protein